MLRAGQPAGTAAPATGIDTRRAETRFAWLGLKAGKARPRPCRGSPNIAGTLRHSVLIWKPAGPVIRFFMGMGCFSF